MSAVAARVFRSVSSGTWFVSKTLNSILLNKELPRPTWAPARLPKSWQRAPMPTGVPRKTLSLCPDCNREAVEAVINGEMTVTEFRDRPGIIEADIVDEAGRILMRKACVKHGPFEDVLSNHPAFFRRMESLAFGKDFECADDGQVHNHGTNGIRRGRGTYLIVDLTNRCNMVCSPCYMDANATSFVHELDMDDVEAIFKRAVSLTRSDTQRAWVSTDFMSPQTAFASPRTITSRLTRGRQGSMVCTFNSTEQLREGTNIAESGITWKSNVARLKISPRQA